MTTSIVIVEDEAMMRAGLRQLLDAEVDLSVVGEATNGLEAQRVVGSLRPDVVVMDVRLPDIDGITATRELTAQHGRRPAVLLLTTFGSEQAMTDGLRAGASGFFLKSAGPEQLAAAIRSVAAGESIVAPALTGALIRRAVGSSEPDRTPVASLSAREQEVLHCMAEGASNADIARNLFLAGPTVKSHVRHIMAKLGAASRIQAVLIARTAGLGAHGERAATREGGPSVP